MWMRALVAPVVDATDEFSVSDRVRPFGEVNGPVAPCAAPVCLSGREIRQALPNRVDVFRELLRATPGGCLLYQTGTACLLDASQARPLFALDLFTPKALRSRSGLHGAPVVFVGPLLQHRKDLGG